MKKITSMYKDYFQKSRIFLYPALEIKRGVSVTPIMTYIAWKDCYGIEDNKLCSLYHLRDDHEFRIFEKQRLLGNKLYHDFKQVDTEKGVYIFDFSHCKKDWEAFINGKYSEFTEEHKVKILDYIGNTTPNYPYVESFLYPEKYFKMYAEMMGVNEKHLKRVGQLCSKPDFDQETLEMSIINLDIIKKVI